MDAKPPTQCELESVMGKVTQTEGGGGGGGGGGVFISVPFSSGGHSHPRGRSETTKNELDRKKTG